MVYLYVIDGLFGNKNLHFYSVLNACFTKTGRKFDAKLQILIHKSATVLSDNGAHRAINRHNRS